MLVRKSTFCQKVTVHKDLKKPACASKRDVLELATLRICNLLLANVKNSIWLKDVLNLKSKLDFHHT